MNFDFDLACLCDVVFFFKCCADICVFERLFRAVAVYTGDLFLEIIVCDFVAVTVCLVELVNLNARNVDDRYAEVCLCAEIVYCDNVVASDFERVIFELEGTELFDLCCSVVLGYLYGETFGSKYAAD